MLLRLLCSVILFGLVAGCRPPAETQSDEQNNVHYRAGKEKIQSLDYKGAVAAFERALEDNPRSALAHFELGLLFDQHENDYPAALYHYNKALKLRPVGYPADNIRQRIPSCRQELVKADSLSVLNPAALRETERLRDENHRLRNEIAALRAHLAGLSVAPVAASRPATEAGTRATQPSSASAPTPAPSRPASPGEPRVTTLPPRSPATGSARLASTAARTHQVQPGETPAAIARQYQIPLSALLAANPGLEPRRMKPGQLLNLP